MAATIAESLLFAALNGITQEVMLDDSRVYGGGIHKLKPKELENVPAPEILRSISEPNWLCRQFGDKHCLFKDILGLYDKLGSVYFGASSGSKS